MYPIGSESDQTTVKKGCSNLVKTGWSNFVKSGWSNLVKTSNEVDFVLKDGRTVLKEGQFAVLVEEGRQWICPKRKIPFPTQDECTSYYAACRSYFRLAKGDCQVAEK